MNRGYVTVGSRRAHVRVGGRGPALLLLHSLPQWSRELATLAEGLAPDFAVLVPDIAGHYREPFHPESSGAHLVRLWSRVRGEQQFRPPHRRQAATRLIRSMPTAAALNDRLLGWLRAGDEAPRVLRAVTRFPLGQALARNELPVETVQSDVDVPQPEQVRAWWAAATASLPHGGRMDLRDWRTADAPTRGFQREFIRVRGGYLHAQISRHGQAHPILALHDPAGTSDLVMSFSRPLAETRPVAALDLPGNVESDNVPGTSSPTSSTYAGVVRHLVQAGITACEPDEARAHHGAWPAETALRAPMRTGHGPRQLFALVDAKRCGENQAITGV